MVESSDTQPLAPFQPHSSQRPLERAQSRTPHLARPRRRRRVLRWILSIGIALTLMVLAGVGGIVGLVYFQARTDEARPVDAIIVMGAAQYNGRPSPVLEARLAHAYELYAEGLAPVIVVTGGKMPGDAYTEAEAGAMYLTERGVPESAIVLENEGRSTWGSLQGVPAVLPQESDIRVLVVSDGFHLFRSELMLRELGYDTYGSAAPNSPISPWTATEFGYALRETGGVLVFLPEYLW